MRKILTLLVALLVQSFCAESKQQTITIALAENFSGVAENSIALAENLRVAVRLAHEDYKERLKKHSLEVVFKEYDLGEEDFNVLAITKNIAESNAIGVIGFNTSNRALLAAPIAQQHKLPIVAASATVSKISTMGPFIHTACVNNKNFAQTLSQFALLKLKAKHALAITAADCSYCTDLTEQFKAAFMKNGGARFEVLAVLSSQSNFSELKSKILNTKADVILNPNHKLLASRLIAYLSENNYRKPFLLADGWGSLPELLFFKVLKTIEYEAFAVDHWHPDVLNKKSDRFEARFLKESNRPADTISALWFDSVSLMLEAVVRNPNNITRENLERNLTAISQFQGVTGGFNFSNNSGVSKQTVLLRASKDQHELLTVVPGGGCYGCFR